MDRKNTTRAYRVSVLVMCMMTLWGCGGGGDGGDGNGYYQAFLDDTSDLTTPELVDAYQQSNHSYGATSQGYGCGGIDIAQSAHSCPPSYIYYKKRGNCGAFTSFAVFCLQQAGFEAYSLKIFSQWPDDFAPNANPRNYHYVALYRDQGQWYTMDNGRGSGIYRGIDGPFALIDDIPYSILTIEDYEGWP